MRTGLELNTSEVCFINPDNSDPERAHLIDKLFIITEATHVTSEEAHVKSSYSDY